MRGAPKAALSAGVVLPTALLVGVGLALTVAAGPLFDVTARAATDLLQRTPYLEAVLEARQ